MSVGLKKRIRIGFLTRQSSDWLGGVNYFKNLFIALENVENPKLIPYIETPDDERAKILLKWAKPLELKKEKDAKYFFNKFISRLSGKKFDKNLYFERNQPIDIISHSHYFLDKKPAISWIPDFQHIHLTQMFSREEINIRNSHYKYLVENSNIVILSSQDVLKDFKGFAPKYAHKARVLHFVAIPEDDIYAKTDAINVEKYALGKKYFYLPNQFWKHKNHKVVFEAIALLKEQGVNVKLVLSGNTGDYRHKEYFDELMNFVKSRNIEENIQNLGVVDSLEVYYLMRNCISVINPSLFEGWSSTVEEAKSLGKNIILSNLNIHKEQNPPGAIYFDPNNPGELASILKKKWANSCGGPDHKLEESAKKELPQRILNFGLEYQKIVLDAVRTT